MEFEMISTSRLQLKKFTPAEFNYIFAHYDEGSIRSLLGIRTDEEYQKQSDRVKGGLSTYNRSLVFFQLIETAGGQIIGGAGFHNWALDHHRAELGYVLDDDAYKNRGFMSEALVPIIAYGFENMGLNRIEACISPQNTPSLKLVEKLGFTREGLMRSHYLKNGIYEDSLIFSLLRSEFEVRS